MRVIERRVVVSLKMYNFILKSYIYINGNSLNLKLKFAVIVLFELVKHNQKILAYNHCFLVLAQLHTQKFLKKYNF